MRRFWCDSFSGSFGAPSAALGISPAGSDASNAAQLRLRRRVRSDSAQDDRCRRHRIHKQPLANIHLSGAEAQFIETTYGTDKSMP